MKTISDYSTLAFIVGKSIDMMAIKLPKIDLYQFFLNDENKSDLAAKLKETGFPRREVSYTEPRTVYLSQRSLDGSIAISWKFEASIYDFEKLVAVALKDRLKTGDSMQWRGDKQLTDKLALTGLGNLLNLMASHDTDYYDPVVISVLKDFKAEFITEDESCEVFGEMSYDAEILLEGGLVKMDYRRSNFGNANFVPEMMTVAPSSEMYSF